MTRTTTFDPGPLSPWPNVKLVIGIGSPVEVAPSAPPPVIVIQGSPGAPGPPTVFVVDDLRPQIGETITLFSTSADYLAGTVELVWNGITLVQGQGIQEVAPNQIQLEIDSAGRLLGPKPGHNLFARYLV